MNWHRFFLNAAGGTTLIRAAKSPLPFWLVASLWGGCLLGSFSVWAQRQPRGYLESCSASQDCQFGLVCTQGKSIQICVHPCDVRQKVCPHGEACKILALGQGACFCESAADCPKGAKCSSGQCSGPGQVGDLCDPTKPCAKDLYCSKPKGASEYRCRVLCTSTVCADQSPCLLVDGTPYSVCFCQGDQECPGGVCINGVCTKTPGLGQRCTKRTGCERGLACHFFNPGDALGRCLRICRNDQGCVGGESCILANRQRVCLCDEKVGCAGVTACKQGLCQAQPRCSKKNPSCPLNKTCWTPVIGLDDGLCVPTCRSANDCQNGTPCQPVRGATKGCVCRSDSECPKGKKCILHECREGCTQHNECPPYKLCRNGVCVFPGPEDTLPERVPLPDVPARDAPSSRPEPRPQPEPRPTCKPACKAPLKCNLQTLKCEKAKIGESCERDADCESGLCFSATLDLLKMCSTKDCTKCKEYGLECRSKDGVTACFTPVGSSPPEQTQQPVCGCDASQASGFWLWLFVLGLWLVWRTGQRRSLKTFPPPES